MNLSWAVYICFAFFLSFFKKDQMWHSFTIFQHGTVSVNQFFCLLVTWAKNHHHQKLNCTSESNSRANQCKWLTSEFSAPTPTLSCFKCIDQQVCQSFWLSEMLDLWFPVVGKSSQNSEELAVSALSTLHLLTFLWPCAHRKQHTATCVVLAVRRVTMGCMWTRHNFFI